MTKRLMIALANHIRQHNAIRPAAGLGAFNQVHIDMIADFIASQNPRFMRQRWLDYVAGKCGPNGGKV
jgi:hypothetical protein